MLRTLSVSNVALIEKQEIEFYDGFSVLTGETGAGKSIIIEALNFVLGERASRELVKTGAKKAWVEARFRLSDSEPVRRLLCDMELTPEDDELVLYRELSDGGKSACRANGTLISVAQLKQIGDALVDIHGQHEHQSLLNPKLHIRLLDSLGGEALLTLREQLGEAYTVASKAAKELRGAEIDERERARRCDLLSYQIEEIDKAELKEDEEEALLEKRAIQQNAQLIMESLSKSAALLSGEEGALPLLSAALRELCGIANYQAEYAALHDRLQEAYYVIEDAAYGTRSQRDEFSYEPGMLDQVEWRLETISVMKRKYGESVAEILRYREKIGAELDWLLTSEARHEALAAAYEAARDAYQTLAKALSERRRQTADDMRRRLLPELSCLGMPHAAFEVRFQELPGELPSALGVDGVEFMLSTNLGEPVKPLSGVASGGEVSRIMLALKSVLADIDGIPTMVFDEIDSGISGRIGGAVAQKMKQIASGRQVLCITHLPQIAARADHQYLVYKETVGEQTTTAALRLNPEERVREIARIMGGAPEDAIALAHARSLIEAPDMPEGA